MVRWATAATTQMWKLLSYYVVCSALWFSRLSITHATHPPLHKLLMANILTLLWSLSSQWILNFLSKNSSNWMEICTAWLECKHILTDFSIILKFSAKFLIRQKLWNFQSFTYFRETVIVYIWQSIWLVGVQWELRPLQKRTRPSSQQSVLSNSFSFSNWRPSKTWKWIFKQKKMSTKHWKTQNTILQTKKKY